MYSGSYGQPNRLATKLRQEYRNRGEDLRGIGASSTEELMRRAQMGRDPRENVSEKAFSEKLRSRQSGAGAYGENAYYAQPTAQQREGRRTSRPATGQPATGQSGNGTNTQRSGSKSASHVAKTKAKQKKQSFWKVPHDGEVKVQGRSFPVGYLAMLAAVTMMIMGILVSISQIYQTTGTIADLEDELVTLQAEVDKLELAIEEKNDIRVIEQIATDQLGMVKEDSVQRKYVSLSDGERIDLIGEEEDIEEGALGTMLSSLTDFFARFLESLGD